MTKEIFTTKEAYHISASICFIFGLTAGIVFIFDRGQAYIDPGYYALWFLGVALLFGYYAIKHGAKLMKELDKNNSER